jgi:hypothetical protein
MSDKDELKDALEEFELCVSAEADNREIALDDLKFAKLGDQWPEDMRRKRELEGRPCLTFNRLPTFTRQVVNDGRQNKPAIRVHPADDTADPKTAEVINGLIRNIEYTSNADIAYDTGLDFAVSCGFGYWRVSMDYACDDTFDMDLMIQSIENPFSVYGDPFDHKADSAEWNICFVTDLLSKSAFKAKYKGAEEVDWLDAGYENLPANWSEGELIRIAERWKRSEVKKKILQLSSGIIVAEEWYKMPADGFPGLTNKDLLDEQGITVTGDRQTKGYKVTQHIMTGSEVLEKNDWPGRYIPIVPVYGEVINIGGTRHLRSLINPAKDAQSNFNYWRTTTTECVALAPKVPFIGPVGSFDTDSDKWQSANTDSHAYIEYDPVPGQPPPQRQQFAGVPAGAMQEALNSADDMKSIMGIYDAALGARSNETSGRAINARKAESDNGTFHFLDNQARAIRHTGRILIDLIPYVYNKARVVRVMGADKKPENVPINQPITGQDGQPQMGEDGVEQIYNLSAGKYDLTVDTGPSFASRREEAAYQMTEFIRAYPPAAPLIGDMLAKNMDWPEADEIADRLKKMLPPQLQGQDPAAQQAQQQIQQMAQEIEKLGKQVQDTTQNNMIEAAKIKVDSYNAETNRLKVVAPAMTPEEIQMMVMQTVQHVMQSPDILPMDAPQATPMPQQELMMEPQPEQMQPPEQPPQGGFFTPEQ